MIIVTEPVRKVLAI